MIALGTANALAGCLPTFTTAVTPEMEEMVAFRLGGAEERGVNRIFPYRFEHLAHDKCEYPKRSFCTMADGSISTNADVLLTGDLGLEKQVIKARHDGFTIDLSDTILHSKVYPNPQNAIPLVIKLDGHDDVVLRGGTVIRHDDPNTRWGQSYHKGIHSSGLTLDRGDGSVTVDGLRLHNTHDGIVVAGRLQHEKYVTVRHVYATHIRDDVIENDGMKDVVVEDSLFDGVFTGFSAVNPSSGKPGNIDPVVTIRGTLVRLENMAGDPTGSKTDDGWGHGRLFKWWDSRAPELVLENNIFVMEDSDGWSDSVNKKIVHSENNILIWMGDGEFRGTLPAGFTLIEGDDGAFREARDAWLERHGYFHKLQGGNSLPRAVETAPK